MRYEFFLAKRYAFSKKKTNFITIISVLSMLGIMVGTAALIIVLSVFNGFSAVVTKVLVSFDPHIRITAQAKDSTAELATISSLLAMREQLAKVPAVESLAPTIREKAVLVHYTLPRVAIVTGMNEDDVRAVSGIGKSILSGELKLDSNSIIVGQLLADDLALVLGDTLQIFSPIGLERILTEPVAPRTRSVIVRGIFAANNREYDAMNAYVSLGTARDLYEVPNDAATSIDIKLKNIQQSDETKKQLTHVLDTNQYSVQTWFDLHHDLYSVMEIERWIAYIILFLIVAVACFNIFSSLTLTVMEKQRDIGLLRAIGASDSGIRSIYLFQGMIIGLIGTLAGCFIGFAVILLQQQFGFFKLDTSVYIIPALPVELRWSDFVLVALGSIACSTFGALMPARRAAKVRPAEALRWE